MGLWVFKDFQEAQIRNIPAPFIKRLSNKNVTINRAKIINLKKSGIYVAGICVPGKILSKIRYELVSNCN